MKEARKVLKKRYNEVNLSELVDWRLNQWIEGKIMERLKHSNKIRKVHSVNLDLGIVKKSKEFLKKNGYQESFSQLINTLLDQWCRNQQSELGGKDANTRI